MDRQSLRDLKKGIDQNFKEFSREYGDGIESFFDPLLSFLIWLEKLLVGAPWPIVIFAFGFLAWVGSRSYKLALGTVLSFLVIGYFGMWKNCMATVAIISVATLTLAGFCYFLIPVTNNARDAGNNRLFTIYHNISVFSTVLILIINLISFFSYHVNQV